MTTWPFIVFLLWLSGCTIVHYQYADGAHVSIIAAAQTRVEIPPSDTCACPLLTSCEACAPLTVDSTIASWWGTTFASIATAFFVAIQVVGWP